MSVIGMLRQLTKPLGIVAVDDSENYPDKKSDCCHTKHDEDIP
jgi:hypothetical protein